MSHAMKHATDAKPMPMAATAMGYWKPRSTCREKAGEKLLNDTVRWHPVGKYRGGEGTAGQDDVCRGLGLRVGVVLRRSSWGQGAGRLMGAGLWEGQARGPCAGEAAQR